MSLGDLRDFASLANLVLLIGLSWLALWIKSKFVQPLKDDLLELKNLLDKKIVEASNRFEAAIREETHSRKIEMQQLAHAVKGLEGIAQGLSNAAIRDAEERGRQAERIHYLSNEVTKTQLRTGTSDLQMDIKERRDDWEKTGRPERRTKPR